MASLGRASWTALGTTVHLLVTDAASIDAASGAVHDVLDGIDRACSRFRDDSELTALNRRPGRPVRVGALLFSAIEASVRAARATSGACDPTVGEAVRILGYDADFAALPDDRPQPRVVIGRVPGWQGIRLDAAGSTVTIPRGVSLDLGSTGKAYAADLAAAAAFAAVGGGVLVSLGGDIATAGAPPATGWLVHCSDDSTTDPRSRGDVVAVTKGAIATSSTSVRRWTVGGVERHHIIDPATSLPASGPWRTATVAAATCVDANAASTAAIVLGREAPEWLRQAGLAARLVGHDGLIARVGGWPQVFASPRSTGRRKSVTAASAA